MSERKFKIKTIKHQLKNNVIAKYGDVVAESQLKYNVSELIKDGFIEEFEVEETAKDSEKSGNGFSDMTKAEIIQYAKDNEIEIDPIKKKEVIIEAIENHIKSIEVNQ
jgi:hypothetical protein